MFLGAQALWQNRWARPCLGEYRHPHHCREPVGNRPGLVTLAWPGSHGLAVATAAD
ncbi:hypothetical protein [Streptomyces scopuliridis]|uniref:hypothetical protein n=1 Tax=Streptomyces scopuliridis TaxID=452529 RepID=UPI0036C836E0